jgi:hypothetical protein
MVVYIASLAPLPLVPWQQDAPAFNVTELTAGESKVCRHFSLPNIRQAGSHTSCGCGFNEAREYPEVHDDPVAERADALESSVHLAQYICKHRVAQVYSCWSGDEAEPREFERTIAPDVLVSERFFFRERELLTIEHSSS